MADNYLERKMEDYRNGSHRHYTPRLTPSGQRPGYLRIPFEPRTVLLALHDGELLTSLVRLLTEAGCRVALMNGSPKTGTALAQASGALFHPGEPTSAADIAKAIDTLNSRWQRLSTLVVISGTDPAKQPEPTVICASEDPDPQRALALTVASLISSDRRTPCITT